MTDRELSGIYEIKNVLNGKRYVGSSKNIPIRFNQHKTMLINGIHHSTALQNAWNKYGPEGFVFNILALLELDDLVSTEQRLLDQVFAEPDNYNISRNAISPMLGLKHKPETLALMSAQRKGEKNAFFGKTHTPEQIEKYKIQNKGQVGWSRGKTLSEEHRKKLSDAKKGKTPKRNLIVITHCKRGHEFTEENTSLYKGHRICRKCKNERQRLLTKRKENCHGDT